MQTEKLTLQQKLVIIVNGPATAGKDTFCDFYAMHAKRHDIDVVTVSSVGAVKKASLLLGWDGQKNEKDRNALSDIKDISEAAWDGPNRYMLKQIEATNATVFFLHIRELSNINRMIELCNEKNITVRTLYIDRAVTQQASNHADAQAMNKNAYPYQNIVENNGSLSELKLKVAEYFQVLKIKSARPFDLFEDKEVSTMYSTYDDLLELYENEKEIDRNIALAISGQFRNDVKSGNELIEYWSFENSSVDPLKLHQVGKYAHLGIFEWSTSWDSLFIVCNIVNYDSKIYINDIRKTYEQVALFIHNKQ